MGIGGMTDNELKLKAFKLKGRLYTLTVLQVLESDIEAFDAQLQAMIEKAPRLFEQAPLVLDCTEVSEAEIDLAAFCASARKRKLFPIAVQGGSPLFHERAAAVGLGILRSSSTQDKPVVEEVSAEENREVAPALKAQTKLLTIPVRSGQQVVSAGDLIVTTSISHGSELLAEGNIHVYGKLRGRVLAGISGNQEARIFCQSFDPELIAIAGVYRLRETIEAYDKPCQIFLKNDRIEIEPL